MLTCSKCGSINLVPKIIETENQLTAWCVSCGEYLKNLPRTAFWLEVLASQKPATEKAGAKAVVTPSGPGEELTGFEHLFANTYHDMQRRAYEEAAAKGWWDRPEDANPLSKMMLVVTELAEAVEGYRKPGESDKIPGFSVQEEEIADAIIRLMDLAGREGLRIGTAIVVKLRYNRDKRTYRHGDKRY